MASLHCVFLILLFVKEMLHHFFIFISILQHEMPQVGHTFGTLVIPTWYMAFSINVPNIGELQMKLNCSLWLMPRKRRARIDLLLPHSFYHFDTILLKLHWKLWNQVDGVASDSATKQNSQFMLSHGVVKGVKSISIIIFCLPLGCGLFYLTFK